MLTIAARSFASSPSGISGNSRKAMSVTTTPRTAVAEELEALVVGGQLVLERVRAVGERELAQRPITEPDAEDPIERFRPLRGALRATPYSTSIA
jgi:hypothetical protein